MTEDDIRRVVAEMLGINPDADADRIATGWLSGAVSVKAAGEAIQHLGLSAPIVVLDLRKVRTIGGRKPWWRP